MAELVVRVCKYCKNLRSICDKPTKYGRVSRCERERALDNFKARLMAHLLKVVMEEGRETVYESGHNSANLPQQPRYH